MSKLAKPDPAPSPAPRPDIQERKQVAAVSSQSFRLLVENVRDYSILVRELVNDLLNYSRCHALDRPPTQVSCEEALAKVLGNLAATLRERNAQVTADPLPTVQGEFTQLMELLQNLIANGIKFNQSARPSVHVGVREEESELVFSIRDNGIGIARQYQERVFAIFQRLHNREQYGGTGMGLTICKKIVERHGGRIWVESIPGQGSTFYFTLPKAGPGDREGTT